MREPAGGAGLSAFLIVEIGAATFSSGSGSLTSIRPGDVAFPHFGTPRWSGGGNEFLRPFIAWWKNQRERVEPSRLHGRVGIAFDRSD